MGNKLTKHIPMWIKCPVAVVAQQTGEFPIKVIASNVFRSFIQHIHASEGMQTRANQLVQKELYGYLEKRYGLAVKQAADEHVSDVSSAKDLPIWVFWWQGEKTAPYIIKTNIYHMRKNAGSHTVNVVDASNYQDFVSIPPHIDEKFRNGKMSITHFSDYLRVKILNEYGGLWIDGSIFVQKQIPEEVFEKPVWTLRNPGGDKSNISNWNWTVGILGGWKGNTLFTVVEKLQSCYWEDHNKLADYFVLDYCLKLAYENIERVRAMIDGVEPSNDHFYYLQENANLSVDMEAYENEMAGTTWLYKLSWKGQYRSETPDGQMTVYEKWKQDYGLSLECGECE